LFLALLPQLLLAGLAPALVVCQEGDGARAVELSVSACCGDALAAPEVSSPEGALRASEDACGDCQDDALSVALQRGAAPSLLCAHLLAPRRSWELPLQRWSTPRRSRAPPEAPPGSALRELATLRLRC